jgi:hypothetical protein
MHDLDFAGHSTSTAPCDKGLGSPATWIALGLAFAIRVVWGLGWAPFATRMFDLPPNLPGT